MSRSVYISWWCAEGVRGVRRGGGSGKEPRFMVLSLRAVLADGGRRGLKSDWCYTGFSVAAKVRGRHVVWSCEGWIEGGSKCGDVG